MLPRNLRYGVRFASATAGFCTGSHLARSVHDVLVTYRIAWPLLVSIRRGEVKLVHPARTLVARIASRLKNGVPDKVMPSAELAALFDADWYKSQDPDLGDEDPLSHFLRIGAARGLNPNSEFDTKWYLSEYPDVAAAGLNPLVHFVAYGAVENRNPSSRFDTAWYRSSNPDVRAQNPLAHFLAIGRAQGRPGRREKVGRREAAMLAASAAIEQFCKIDDRISDYVTPATLGSLPSWTGQAFGLQFETWRKLFFSIPMPMRRVLFVPFGDNRAALSLGLAALDLLDPGAPKDTLVISTEKEGKSGISFQSSSLCYRELEGIEPNLSRADRAELVKTLIHCLQPRVIVNAGSRACFDAIAGSGAALSLNTEIGIVVSEKISGKTARDACACFEHSNKILFDSLASRELFRTGFNLTASELDQRFEVLAS